MGVPDIVANALTGPDWHWKVDMREVMVGSGIEQTVGLDLLTERVDQREDQEQERNDDCELDDHRAAVVPDSPNQPRGHGASNFSTWPLATWVTLSVRPGTRLTAWPRTVTDTVVSLHLGASMLRRIQGVAADVARESLDMGLNGGRLALAGLRRLGQSQLGDALARGIERDLPAVEPEPGLDEQEDHEQERQSEDRELDGALAVVAPEPPCRHRTISSCRPGSRLPHFCSVADFFVTML